MQPLSVSLSLQVALSKDRMVSVSKHVQLLIGFLQIASNFICFLKGVDLRLYFDVSVKIIGRFVKTGKQALTVKRNKTFPL